MIAALPHAAALASDIAISSRSRFSDSIWHLDGLRPGGNRSDFSLDWDFAVAAGRFTDPGFAPWCEAAKTFLWSVKVDPPPGRKHLHDGTLTSLFKALRLLIRWMADQGYRRFAELDRDAGERFLSAMAARRNAKGRAIAPSTMKLYRRLLVLIYLQGARYPAVAIDDPFPGVTGMLRTREGGWLPYTPDAIAVPLVSSALRLIGPAADDVIALYRQARTPMTRRSVPASARPRPASGSSTRSRRSALQRFPARTRHGRRRRSPAPSGCASSSIASMTRASW
jgi:hypothetical protein